MFALRDRQHNEKRCDYTIEVCCFHECVLFRVMLAWIGDGYWQEENEQMANISDALRRPQVLFFGMDCDFSLLALQTLLQSDIAIRAVVIPMPEIAIFGKQTPPAILPMSPPRSIAHTLPMRETPTSSMLQMAWEHHIPVWAMRKLGAIETLTTLSTYQPDIICVACFSKYIPRSLLALPHLGCLNVHPSLLPDNRGPLPLFGLFALGMKRPGLLST